MDQRSDQGAPPSLRKRGWSMHSEATAQSEDQMTLEQKEALLNNFPQHDDDDDDDDDDESHEQSAPVVDDDTKDNDEQPPRKKQKVSDELLQHAKTKLSKWAARLFDPDRPRGLVQAPQIIPLNDEFLIAFGKRERETDVKLGRTIVIDEEEIRMDDENDDTTNDAAPDAELHPDFGSLEGRKAKITNLAYTTTQERLLEACLKYGPVQDVKLVMDKEDRTRSTGRAYVTFEQQEDTDSCMKNLTTLDGRPLRWSLADAVPPKTPGGPRKLPSRYWERDISTKCYRCGKVGHMAESCPNSNNKRTNTKPCPLCASLDHDNPWQCNMSRICFKCGLPGHVNRDCPERNPLPKRVVCSICFSSGHYRSSCRSSPLDAPNLSDAKCSQCHELGHFQCADMKWFFGLDGVSCFNCGRRGHSGYDGCDRPPLEVCARDEGLAKQEIDQAPARQLADDLQQQKQQRGRGRRDDDSRRRGGNDNRNRAKSQPPPRNNNNNNRGYNNNGGGGNHNNNTNNRGYSGGGGGGGNYNRGYNDNGGGGGGGGNNNNRGYGGGGGGGNNNRGYNSGGGGGRQSSGGGGRQSSGGGGRPSDPRGRPTNRNDNRGYGGR